MHDSCSTAYESQSKDNNTLFPVSKGEEKCQPGYTWGPGVRSVYLIHYVIDGEGTFWCGTKKYQLKKGDIFTIFPGTIVKYQADSNNPWHYSWVCFMGEESKRILKEAGISVLSPVLSVQNGVKALECLREMPHERGMNLKEDLIFSARLYDFLSTLLPSDNSFAATKSTYFATASNYIKAHYSENISVDNIASFVGISRKYLFAIFKEFAEKSPKDYLTDYRIKRSMEFLLKDSLPIGSIAYSVGYTDQLAFSKIFKAKTGMSPSEYREKNLNR